MNSIIKCIVYSISIFTIYAYYNILYDHYITIKASYQYMYIINICIVYAYLSMYAYHQYITV